VKNLNSKKENDVSVISNSLLQKTAENSNKYNYNREFVKSKDKKIEDLQKSQNKEILYIKCNLKDQDHHIRLLNQKTKITQQKSDASSSSKCNMIDCHF
jgi:hypothetical protein